MKCSRFAKFRRDEDGAIIVFVIVLFLVMFIASGMAIDFMRHETARADLQNALDRGVLAAADINQTATDQDGVTNQDVVVSYMRARGYHGAEPNVSVTSPTVGPNARRIVATAHYDIDTYFLKFIGMPTLRVPATAEAQHGDQNMEISLVVDISGSMDRDSTVPTATGTKLDLLKEAAIDFVDTVLTDETRDRTFISLVPYNATTALPAYLATEFQMQTEHSYSYCAQWQEADFNSVAVPVGTMIQSQHFRETESRYHCSFQQGLVLPYSNDNTQLPTAINALDGGGWTAVYNGLKIASALLDPAARPVVTGLIDDGYVSNSFSEWPSDYYTDNVNKIVVIMTDGRNTRLKGIPQDLYAATAISNWDTVNAGPLAIDVINNKASASSDPDGFGEGDHRMHALCSALHVQGVLVYTVGFELVDGTYDGLRATDSLAACGSSSANNYLVEGEQINDAFQAIANEIINLKLIN